MSTIIVHLYNTADPNDAVSKSIDIDDNDVDAALRAADDYREEQSAADGKAYLVAQVQWAAAGVDATVNVQHEDDAIEPIPADGQWEQQGPTA